MNAHDQWMLAWEKVNALPEGEFKKMMKFELNLANEEIEDGEVRPGLERLRRVHTAIVGYR